MDKHKLHMEIRKLTAAEVRAIEELEQVHRDKLAKQGYTTQALVDETGCFGVVLVSDPHSGRTGFVLPNGNVRWIGQSMSPGALADATVSGVKVERLP